MSVTEATLPKEVAVKAAIEAMEALDAEYRDARSAVVEAVIEALTDAGGVNVEQVEPDLVCVNFKGMDFAVTVAPA